MRPPGGFTEDEWAAARPWNEYLDSVEDKRDVWLANAKRAKIDEEAAARLGNLPGRRRVLVLTEDWCGDAARSVPTIALALERTPLVEHRYLDSDEHGAVVERYLTHGGRGIPLAIVQDESGAELGTWGPRPAPLQALFRARRRELGTPDAEEMAAFYAPVMAWYGKDRGKTVLAELLMLLERGGDPR